MSDDEMPGGESGGTGAPSGTARPSRRRGRTRGRRGGGGNGGDGAVGTVDRPHGDAPRIEVAGVLELTDRGGFLRAIESSYLATPNDPFIPQALVQRHKLRPGDEVAGEALPARGGRGPTVDRIISVFGQDPAVCEQRREFSRLPASHPTQALKVTSTAPRRRGTIDVTGALIDLLAPLGKGQRALVVAPAKAGKTTLLTNIARGILANTPDITLYILLADERPEEVTEMEMAGAGEVIASSFDHGAARHVAVAEMTLERARRRVELGEDVVIILDSLTRLARAYNTIDKGSGRTLSGGIGAEAMERPKRFFGSARAVDARFGGGSLTIIATALIDTGSRGDEVIFEEFKGTGNAEIVLNRELAERRVFPAIDVAATGTRREELLLDKEALSRSHEIRQQVAGLPLPKQLEVVRDILERGL